MRNIAVYIITNQKNGTLYVCVTGNLIKRIWEHKNKIYDGFSKKYNLSHLVYYEMHENMESAITREKQMKKWKREWKIRLIKEINPNLDDLYNQINGLLPSQE